MRIISLTKLMSLDRQGFRKVTVNYKPSDEYEIVPSGCCVVIDDQLGKMFEQVLKASTVINHRAFWDKDDDSFLETEMLAGGVNLMDLDNAHALKNFLGGVRRYDWDLVINSISPDVQFSSNNWMGSVIPELLQGVNATQLMKALKQWRKAQGDYHLKLHMALTTTTMGFITYELIDKPRIDKPCVEETLEIDSNQNIGWLEALRGSIVGDLPFKDIPEQKSDLDDTRDELIIEAGNWHKPQYYQYNAEGESIRDNIPPIHLENRKLQTVYYTFGPDHRIRSMQHILEISGVHLASNTQPQL